MGLLGSRNPLQQKPETLAPARKVTSKYELTIHKKGGSFQGWRCAEVSWGLDQSYQYRWEGRVITHKALQVQIPDSPLLAA